MRAIQNLIIAEVLETTITQYGIQSEPKEKVQKMIEQAEQMMKSSELSLYEKLAQHELLKHGQVMSGLVVHKAAQIAGADVEEGISPLISLTRRGLGRSQIKISLSGKSLS